jgi:hypothetical protein
VTHQQKVIVGVGAISAGSWLLYQAFEGSGRKRPFWARLIPGP